MSEHHFRVSFGVVKRAEGHSAVKRSAYQTCTSRTDHQGTVFDYSRKAQEHRATVMLVPANAPSWTSDPAEVWRRCEQSEVRCDAQPARLFEVAIPREVPEHVQVDFARVLFQPLADDGMIIQLDIQRKKARDGGWNDHIHGVASMRHLDTMTETGFSRKKERAWNAQFADFSKGQKPSKQTARDARALFAERMNEFCAQHGIGYVADARSNRERGLPTPEPALPPWNFKQQERTGRPTAAIFDLEAHRRRRHDWKRARADAEQAEAEFIALRHKVLARRPALASADPAIRAAGRRDRRAAVLAAWHKRGWVDSTEAERIKSARLDEQRNCLWINLWDGSVLVDTGESVQLRSAITWSAALETAAAAERHGWKTCIVSGPKSYRDGVTIACRLRGIEVENHRLNAKAQAQLDRLLAEQEAQHLPPAPGVQSEQSDNKAEWERIQRLRRRAAAAEPEEEERREQTPAYVPSWARERNSKKLLS